MAERVEYGRLAAQPWKNGGGSTTELKVYPAGSGFDQFHWRLSVADVGTDGPFSLFPGVDRTISLLEGSGMRLVTDTNTQTLLTAQQPLYQFPGEILISASLLNGPTKDFNVMTRRDRCRHQVRVEAVDGVVSVPQAGNWTVVFVMKGEVGVRNREEEWTLRRYDALVLRERGEVQVQGQEAMVLVVEIYALG